MKENKLETITNLFENNTIRSIWDAEKEEYYFSVIDVIGALTNNDYQKSRNYWKWLKNKLNDDDFRILIKLKIVKNETNMTAKNIDDNIYQLFKNVVYTTWGECMEMTYNYDFKLSNIIELAKEKECLPAPTGVKINLKEINNG